MKSSLKTSLTCLTLCLLFSETAFPQHAQPKILIAGFATPYPFSTRYLLTNEPPVGDFTKWANKEFYASQKDANNVREGNNLYSMGSPDSYENLSGNSFSLHNRFGAGPRREYLNGDSYSYSPVNSNPAWKYSEQKLSNRRLAINSLLGVAASVYATSLQYPSR